MNQNKEKTALITKFLILYFITTSFKDLIIIISMCHQTKSF